MSQKWDLFISHASEDKDFVRPLAIALRAENLAVWFDEFELKPGMGLRDSIDHGLSASRFGLVVLSPAFFRNKWTSRELDGLFQVAESQDGKTIIPVWHEVGRSEVAAFSPSLANIVAIDSQSGTSQVVEQVLLALNACSVKVQFRGEGTESQTIPVVKPQLDVQVLCNVARRNTLQEISSSVGRKYIRDLYVHREQETVINRYLYSDEELHFAILEIREYVNSSLIECIDEFEKTIESAKTKERIRLTKLRRDISNRHKKIDKKFDELLTNTDGIVARRSDICQLAVEIDEISAVHESVNRAVLDASRQLRWLALPALVLIDRAGGGKTNLLCRIAEERGNNNCVLFISGRTSVEAATSLLNHVANLLGWNQQCDSTKFLHLVDKSLNSARQFLIVIVDGINENRRTNRLSEALQTLVSFAAECLRVRVVITCRDIYWRFFSGAKWASELATMEQGKLYEFTAAERSLAIQRYLEFFHIEVQFGSRAYERCKHPLLLRFFCEAYGNPEGQLHRFRDKVDEIRLKPLFDDYWNNKVVKALGRVPLGTYTAEHCLTVLADHMFGAATSTVLIEEFVKISSVIDIETRKSPYVQLLDEDILIDELPSNEGLRRRVVFVYEEFMEYVIARGVFQKIEEGSGGAVIGTVKLFKTQLSRGFVNALGVAEYLCAFLLDGGMNRTAMHILAALGERDHYDATTEQGWDNVISNVFVKYENSLVMLSECCVFHENKLWLSQIVGAIARTSRPLLVNACIAIILTIILPREVTPRSIISGQSVAPLRNSEILLVSDYKKYSKILRMLFRVILQSGVNASRNGYWKQLLRTSAYYGPTTRVELIILLGSILPNTPYFTMLQICFCNGLFDADRDVRFASASVVRGLRHIAVQNLITIALSDESDHDVRSLLR